MESLYQDAHKIIQHAIAANLPGEAVRNALKCHTFTGNISLAAIGKAAWHMAKAAYDELGDRIQNGIVITKYNHSQGPIANMDIWEAGHPLSDNNTLLSTQKAIELAESLGEQDELLLLISGGGSALFEKPLPGISLDDIIDVNQQLLASGADIVEMNMIRKRLSCVKAGRFAEIASPAKIFTVVLSDVLGDRLDSIASGPAAPDMSTVDDAKKIVEKYNLKLNSTIRTLLERETPKATNNVETVITGSVSTLCSSAAQAAQALGYQPYILCSDMDCEARDAGMLIAAIARQIGKQLSIQPPCALIFGGETVVHLKGTGKGGRNQELALAAAQRIEGLRNVLLFSFGSDGTDGPTDAAGGIVDGQTVTQLKEKGWDVTEALHSNDAYHALQSVDRLILTGPTGTNVNDIAVILCR